MKRLLLFPALLASALWIIGMATVTAQVCSNQALAFDGNGDYITLSPLPAPFPTSPVFTAEAWFYANSPGGANCVNSIRRLFSFSGGSSIPTFSVLDIGLCNGGQLHYKYRWGTGGLFIASQISPAIVTNACHHLAVTYNANVLQVYLDGVLLNTITIPANIAFEFNTFQVGHSVNGAAGEDWDGLVDEIRLWNTVRTQAEIRDFKDCTLSGTSPGLLVNWPLNQGAVPDGPNPGITTATDVSGNGNHGTLNGFNLAAVDPLSNFVCNPCPPLYQLGITDLPFQNTLLTAICVGGPAHFCVTNNNFTAVSVPPGATVTWESSDGGGPFVPDPDLGAYSNALNALCFPVQANVITYNCNNSATGYVDRTYRAVITKTMTVGTQTQVCTYTTTEHDLQICCPITNAQVNFTVQPPTPFNGTLCEGQVVVDVSLASTHPYLVPLSPNGNVTIQWCVNNVHDPNLDNLLSFTYTGPATAPNLCFEAKIQNCACAMLPVKVCIPVDKVPMCGTIDQMSALTATAPYEYVICPGDDAVVGMVNPADFKNCNPVWQYHFDTDVPGPGFWKDLGASNQNQNTNTLPQLNPPNPPNPAIWPAGATCIIYRIACSPLSAPNSGCDTCFSNEVKICLLPTPTYTLSGSPPQICAGGSFSTLNIFPVPPSTAVINWYWNGLQVINSGISTYLASQTGCYWATIFDGCFTITTQKYCVEVCEIVPIIKCPTDNPCACAGLPITLDGCDSYNTCANTGPLPLIFSWTASNGGPCIPSGPNGCMCTHTPDHLLGTTYTLTVTDPNLGCTATSPPFFIKPCH